MAGDICYCHDSGVGGGRVLLASDVWRPGVLPHTVPGTGRAPAKNHQVRDTVPEHGAIAPLARPGSSPAAHTRGHSCARHDLFTV